MEIRLDNHLVTTTMRTPGDDFELATGFLFTDGHLGGNFVEDVRYCTERSALETNYNVVTVETGGRAPVPTPRLTTTTSSCGLCGSTSLDELRTRYQPLGRTTSFALDLLAGLPSSLLGDQRLFSATGAVHAAVAFDEKGRSVVSREDVGRHNAVDKVVGRLWFDQKLPAAELGLLVSGRASFEIVQKAWAAGFGTIVAVSAPTALAVDTARVAGITLAGFVRDQGFNLYSPA